MNASCAIDLEPAVPIAVSAAGEQRWGFFCFPKLSRLPDTRMLLTFNNCPDDDAYYGDASPAYVSDDNGGSWQPFHGEPAIRVSHSPVSEVLDGEFLCTPFTRALDSREVEMPEAIGKWNHYSDVLLHHLDAFDDDVQPEFSDLKAVRWSAERGWQKDTVRFDTKDMLVRRLGNSLSRGSFEYRLFRSENRLIYPAYVVNYLWDGAVPKAMAIHTMVSTDNGRSFERVGMMFHDPTGRDHFGEADIAETTDGRLISVVRRAMREQRPLAKAYSADGGLTWSPWQCLEESLGHFGVMPNLLRLENGVLCLTYGRPGVHLAVSADGNGEHWAARQRIVEGEQIDHRATTCGYTSMLPLGPESLLLAYTTFGDPELPAVERCRTVWVRRIKVRR